MKRLEFHQSPLLNYFTLKGTSGGIYEYECIVCKRTFRIEIPTASDFNHFNDFVKISMNQLIQFNIEILRDHLLLNHLLWWKK